MADPRRSTTMAEHIARMRGLTAEVTALNAKIHGGRGSSGFERKVSDLPRWFVVLMVVLAFWAGFVLGAIIYGTS